MVQEVECRETEFKLLALRDLEVLVYTKIATKERRCVDIGPNQLTIDSLLTGSLETVGVEVLSMGQVFRRIANQNGFKSNAVSAEHRLIAHWSPVRVQTGTSKGLERRSSLVLGDSGELPAVGDLAQHRVVERAGQVDHIRSIEDVEAVKCQGSVVVSQMEGIKSSA